MMVVIAPAKQAIFLSNYDAKFFKSIRVILSGVTQLSVRDPEIGGASAAHTPYFRHPFVNCVSPIFIDGKNRKGPGKFPVLARFTWLLNPPRWLPPDLPRICLLLRCDCSPGSLWLGQRRPRFPSGDRHCRRTRTRCGSRSYRTPGLLPLN